MKFDKMRKIKLFTTLCDWKNFHKQGERKKSINFYEYDVVMVEKGHCLRDSYHKNDDIHLYVETIRAISAEKNENVNLNMHLWMPQEVRCSFNNRHSFVFLYDIPNWLNVIVFRDLVFFGSARNSYRTILLRYELSGLCTDIWLCRNNCTQYLLCCFKLCVHWRRLFCLKILGNCLLFCSSEISIFDQYKKLFIRLWMQYWYNGMLDFR